MTSHRTLHDPKVRQVGRRHLRQDAVLATLMRRHGDSWPKINMTRFDHLATAILNQQISTKAAATIRRRFVEALGGRITAERILALDEKKFREAGLSKQKQRYILDLARRVEAGELRLRGLHRLDNEQVQARLEAILGIGRWTAQVFLLFELGRPDVLATGDLGLQAAAHNLYDLKDRPSPAQLEELAEPWRPYRGLASWYLWRSLHEED